MLGCVILIVLSLLVALFLAFQLKKYYFKYKILLNSHQLLVQSNEQNEAGKNHFIDENKSLREKLDSRNLKISQLENSIQAFNRELDDWLKVYEYTLSNYKVNDRSKISDYKPKKCLKILKIGIKT